MDADRREVNRQAAIELHAALDNVDELWHIAVARVEAGVRVDDSYDWA